MPLTGRQINELAELMGAWGFQAIDLFAVGLGIASLQDLGPGQSTEELARRFLNVLNSDRPPRDRELLEALQQQGSAGLKQAATHMLTPPFLSPSGDAHDAILLDRTAFVDRDPLRKAARRLTASSATSTRVLVVRGEKPSGKSYSWQFLHHLAVNVVGAIPQRLTLKDTLYTPRQIFEETFRLLALPVTDVPPMPDNPQDARIAPLVNAFKGKVVKLPEAYWLVIDDLNDPSVTTPMRDAAYAIAAAAEEAKPPNLWVVLLGYNQPITASDLRHIPRDEAQFPDATLLAEHFELVARNSSKPLPADKSREIAQGVFAQFSPLDKAAMADLKGRIEDIDADLQQGIWP